MMSAEFKASNMVMVTPLLGNVDIAAVYHVLSLSCPRSVTGETIQIVSGAREKVPYYGAPNTIVAIRYNGKSRGIRTGEGQLSNVVSIDLQCYDKNIHLKLSNGKIQLTGALSEEMGSGASQILCLHLNMAQDHIVHIRELSPEIRDLTRNWVLNVTKGPPISRNEPVNSSRVKSPAMHGDGPLVHVQSPMTQPPRLDDLQNIVRLHRRGSSICSDPVMVRGLPRVQLPSFGISRSLPGTLTPNSPYKSNLISKVQPHDAPAGHLHTTSTLNDSQTGLTSREARTGITGLMESHLDKGLCLKTQMTFGSSASGVGPFPGLESNLSVHAEHPDTEYLVNEVTPELFEHCPSNLDQRLAKFLLVHTLGCRTYIEYQSRVNILLQLKFVCTPNLQPGPSKVSNAVYNYTAPITAPLPLLEITNFLHLQDLDVSYHNWNSRCIHISIPILPSTSTPSGAPTPRSPLSRSEGASTPQRVLASNSESFQISPSQTRVDQTLGRRGPFSPRTELSRSESQNSTSDLDLAEDEVSVGSEDELDDSETPKDKIKIYAHRFNIYSKGTVRQSSPTTQDQAYAAYLKVMSVLNQFETVKKTAILRSRNEVGIPGS